MITVCFGTPKRLALFMDRKLNQEVWSMRLQHKLLKRNFHHFSSIPGFDSDLCQLASPKENN